MKNLIRPERNDHIHVGSLSPLAFESLAKLAEAAEWHPVQKWMQPELVLLLIERLKHVKDDLDVFPKGKWATIHRLEELFAEGMWSPRRDRGRRGGMSGRITLHPLTGQWIARCCACGCEYERGIGSTECCGSLQEIVWHDPKGDPSIPAKIQRAAQREADRIARISVNKPTPPNE